MSNADNASYYRFTGPQRLDKAIHALEGLLKGIAADGVVNGVELRALEKWLAQYEAESHRHPFKELIPPLRNALADCKLDEDERDDLIWLCNKLTTDNVFFCEAASNMQRLHGMMAGVAIDGKITREELAGLKEWMADFEQLKGCWPYDELDSLILDVLKDGSIDEHEHRALMAFFTDFAKYTGHSALQMPADDNYSTVSGICAVCPEITFSDRVFCLTGKSERCSRAELIAKIEGKGGRHSKRVAKDVSYVIIGVDGNPCWAYACYGRKVEAAVNFRKQGSSILLVHEYDFWDAYADDGLAP